MKSLSGFSVQLLLKPQWSKGLKALFEVGKESDEEVAARQDDKAELLGRIELEDWRRVMAFDLRGEILELARPRVGACPKAP